MVSNAYVIVFGLAPHDTETPKWVADSLGKKMVRRKERKGGIWGFFNPKIVAENARELLTDTEVATMLSPNSDKQIVLSPMNLPMLLTRLTFKPMKINDEYGSIKFQTFGLDGLRGHFFDLFKDTKTSLGSKLIRFFKLHKLKKYVTRFYNKAA